MKDNAAGKLKIGLLILIRMNIRLVEISEVAWASHHHNLNSDYVCCKQVTAVKKLNINVFMLVSGGAEGN